MNNSNTSSLLDEYKKYDYLNQDSKNPLIKILVSYIKPSFLFKTEILTPIHLGRAVEKENSKDGAISQEDIKWLHENCIGDDDFEGNISSTNRRVGFLTGTYWAWKNYEKLGNPQYFGSFGYRRLFAPCSLKNLKNYDAIIPTPESFTEGSNIKKQFISAHGLTLYNIMHNCLEKVHGEDISLFDNYFKLPYGYFRELYVLKKKLFFDFCNWIFPLLFSLLNLDKNAFKYAPEEVEKLLKRRKKSKNEFEIYMMRDIAFIMERFTGFYLYKLQQDKTNKILENSIICTINTIDEYKKTLTTKEIIINNLSYHIKKLQQKYIISTSNTAQYEENITFISVVNNYQIYEKYIKQNPLLNNCSNISFVDLNNEKENIIIAKRYNQFLNSYNFDRESWFIFCHPDWEIRDNINEKVKTFDKNKIYGPVGAILQKFKDSYFGYIRGFVYETMRDESNFRILSTPDTYINPFQKADTLDCMCMIIHSSLIKKHNLRFDENLNWNLYIEDFCIQAKKHHNIETNTFDIESYHHSNAGYYALPTSYYSDLDYLNKKYPDEAYAGTCSIIGAKNIKLATQEDRIMFNIRKKIINEKQFILK